MMALNWPYGAWQLVYGMEVIIPYKKLQRIVAKPPIDI
jgi:hypothetical protein